MPIINLSKLADQTKALKELSETEGWNVIKSEAEKKREKQTQVMLAEIKNQYPVNERRVGWYIGFAEGMDWVLSRPSSTERLLKTKLAKKETVNE